MVLLAASLATLSAIPLYITILIYIYSYTSIYRHNSIYTLLYISKYILMCGYMYILISVYKYIFILLQINTYLYINYISIYTYIREGIAVAQWLRCCATNRKVAVSIPAGFIGFSLTKSF